MLTAMVLASLLPGAPRAAADPSGLPSLGVLAEIGDVEVALDAARFAEERVAVIRITNKRAWPLRGWVGACATVFATRDPRDSPLRPAESGPFIVPGQGRIQLARPFRLVDPAKRPPGRGAYALDEEAGVEPGCKD
jgi:hypothetical protein